MGNDFTVKAVLEAYDKGFSSGMKKASAVMSQTEHSASGLGAKIKSGLGFGVLMSIGMKAVNSISSAITNNLGSAVKRFDTLNNFPKIMKNLGYSAKDAEKAMDKMSKGIDGLPTALDDISGAATKIAPLTGNLDKATDVTLALNNALLAGGKDAATQSNALEQFSQMMSAGKVDMQAWRSMLSAMPGQMDQLAKSILGADASQSELYEAMKSGKVSFEDFNDALIKLNNDGLETGGKKFASFAKQAKDATGGIGTAIANTKNRVVKGLTSMIEQADKKLHIADSINKFSTGVKESMEKIAKSKAFGKVLKGIQSFIKGMIPVWKAWNSAIGKVISAMVNAASKGDGLKNVFSKFTEISIKAANFIGRHAETIAKLAGVVLKLWLAFKGFSILSSVGGAIAGLTGKFLSFGGTIAGAGSKIASFAASLGPVGLGATAAVVGVAALGFAIYKLSQRYKEAQKEAQKTIDANDKAFGETSAQTGRVDELYRELENLNKKTHKTADEKERMRSIVEQLNSQVEGLNANYDIENDKLDTSIGKIKEKVDAYKEAAKASALEDAVKKDEEQIVKNEDKLRQYAEEKAKIEKQIADVGTPKTKFDRDYLTGLQSKLEGVEKKIGDVKKANQNLEDDITGRVNEMNFDSSAFDDLIAKAKKAGFEVPDQFLLNFARSGKAVPESVYALMQQVEPSFGMAVQNAKQAGVQIPQELVNSIEQGQVPVGDAVNMINAIIATKTGDPTLLQQVGNNGKNVNEAFKKWLGNTMGVSEDTQKLVDQVTGTLGKAPPKAASASKATSKAYANNLGSSSGTAKTNTSDLVNISTSPLSGVPGIFGSTGLSASNRFATNVGASAGAAGAGAKKDKSAAVGAINGTAAIFGSEGVNASTRYASGVGSKAGAAGNEGGKVKSHAIGRMSGGDTYSIGANLTQGFINGMGSLLGSVVSTASNIVGNAISTMMKKAKEHSPSRVTKKIGRYFTQGFVIGMAKGIKSARNTAAGLISSVTKEMTMSMKNKKASTPWSQNFQKKAEAGLKILKTKIDKRVSAITKSIKKKFSSSKLNKKLKGLFGKKVDKKEKKTLDKLKKTYGTSLKAVGDKATKALKNASNKMYKAAETKLNKLATKYQAAYDKIVDAKNTFEGNLKSFGGLYKTDTYGFFEFKDWNKSIADIKKLQSNLKKIQSWGVSQAYISEITAMSLEDQLFYTNKLISAGKKVTQEQAKGYDAYMAQASSTAKSIFQPYVDALDVKYNKELKTVLNSLKNEFTTIGKQAGQGLIKGLSDKKTKKQLNKITKGLASSIISQIRKTLKIHSPSRVMVGLMQMVGEGAVRGLESMQRAVTQATDDLITIPQVQMASGPAFQGAYTAGYTTQASYVVEVPLYIDGREFARATAKDMQYEINKNETKVNRNKGIR